MSAELKLCVAVIEAALDNGKTIASVKMAVGAISKAKAALAQMEAAKVPEPTYRQIGMKHESYDGRSQFIWWGDKPAEGVPVYVREQPDAAPKAADSGPVAASEATTELHEAIDLLLHKFERAGGPWKVANFGVELGAPNWASNVENALGVLARCRSSLLAGDPRPNEKDRTAQPAAQAEPTDALKVWREVCKEAPGHLHHGVKGLAFTEAMLVRVGAAIEACAQPAPAVPEGWIAVEERLPGPNVGVLAYCKSWMPGSDQPFLAHRAGNCWWDTRRGKVIESVSHWMAAPTPPDQAAPGEGANTDTSKEKL